MFCVYKKRRNKTEDGEISESYKKGNNDEAIIPSRIYYCYKILIHIIKFITADPTGDRFVQQFRNVTHHH